MDSKKEQKGIKPGKKGKKELFGFRKVLSYSQKKSLALEEKRAGPLTSARKRKHRAIDCLSSRKGFNSLERQGEENGRGREDRLRIERRDIPII